MKIILPFLSMLISISLFSQTTDYPIDHNFNNYKFSSFVNEIEQITPCHFYFDSTFTKDIIIKQTNVPSRLSNILSKTLEEQRLSYFIDLNGNVILTHNYQIHSELPDELIKAGSTKTQVSENFTNSDYIRNQSQKIHRSSNSHKSNVINVGSGKRNSELVTLSGYMRSAKTNEPLIGGVVYSKTTKHGTITDLEGFYEIELPSNMHLIEFRYVGFIERSIQVELNNSGNLNIDLEPQVIQLNDIVITSEKEHNVSGIRIGVNKIKMKTLKQIPTTMGEVDLIKSAILLPGVQTVGEAASGFNVRGGSTDQNLMLLDGCPLFNTSHLFGFFSVFNPDIVDEYKLYKSGIPAKYGGRLSSVFNVSTKHGNTEKISGMWGISPLAGRLLIEGPIIKNKLAFIISARTSYSDWLLKKINNSALKNSAASFYDVYAKLSYNMNKKSSIYLSGYSSTDNFSFVLDTTYGYTNTLLTAGFKHVFSKSLHANLSANYSKYTYSIVSDRNPFNAFELKYFIEHKELKADFNYFTNNSHKFNFGGNIIHYNLNPGSLYPTPESIINSKLFNEERGFEPAIYVSDEYKVSEKLMIEAGLRYSMFLVQKPLLSGNISDNGYLKNNNKNGITKTYNGLEYRLAARYKTGFNNSLKFSYNRLYQYIHRLSNTAAISPTDAWHLTNAKLKPQRGDQYVLGFYQNLIDNTLESSVEVYYKSTDNLIEYRQGATLLLNENLEADLLSGIGRAYGVEILLKKNLGRLSGWVSYTYSKSEVKVDGDQPDDMINQGNYYPANYDKPHDFTLVSNVQISRRINFSNSFTYSTGRPITYPVAKYQFQERYFLHYSNRNEYRIKDYLRLDFSVNVEGNLKSKKLAHSSLSFSVYNVTGRRNVYSVFFKSNSSGEIKGYSMSIFSRPIPTITYNFKF